MKKVVLFFLMSFTASAETTLKCKINGKVFWELGTAEKISEEITVTIDDVAIIVSGSNYVSATFFLKNSDSKNMSVEVKNFSNENKWEIENKSYFKESKFKRTTNLELNRSTGLISINISSKKADINYTGSCEKIKKNKF